MLNYTNFDFGIKYSGKVRDNYSIGDRRFIITTDRISAFDRVLGTIPFKGQLLTQLTAWWFDRTKKIAPNHLISNPDPNVLECIECTPLPVEMVVRAYITGSTSTSMWYHYQNGARKFCGYDLPDGLNKNDKLPYPIITPSTKAPLGQHDVSCSREELLNMGKISVTDYDTIAEMSFLLFQEGSFVAMESGLILVDTKYEFGKTVDGQIVVIDEIHTPDSSRFWVETKDGYLSLDKDYVRNQYKGYLGDGDPAPLTDEIKSEAYKRYKQVYEMLTDMTFIPNRKEPIERIKNNLKI